VTSLSTKIKDFVGYTKAAQLAELNTMSTTEHEIASTRESTGSSKQYNKWKSKSEKAHADLDNGPQSGFRHGINVIKAAKADGKV
jgi:hypothetical protein